MSLGRDNVGFCSTHTRAQKNRNVARLPKIMPDDLVQGTFGPEIGMIVLGRKCPSSQRRGQVERLLFVFTPQLDLIGHCLHAKCGRPKRKTSSLSGRPRHGERKQARDPAISTSPFQIPPA